MVLIPKYLREIAEIVDCKTEKLTVRIKCPCGCGGFFVLKNIPKKVKVSKEIAEKIRLSKKWWNEVLYKNENVKRFRGDFSSQISITYGKRNTLVHRFKEGEVPLSEEAMYELQPTDINVVFKAVCANCKKEYLLFDNRIHGNDAADFKPLETEEYAFKRKKIGGGDAPAELLVAIENFWDFDDIEDNGNEGLTADDYSEMFNGIKIYAVNADGKKIKVYFEDLG
jgi:hypothetical protein